MKKEINFILEKKDFKKDSGVSRETFDNLFESFNNYLDLLDTQELKDVNEKGKIWTIETLYKVEKKKVKFCRDIINGEMALIDEKGKMSSLNSTRKIILKLIPQVNQIILIRDKIRELEK